MQFLGKSWLEVNQTNYECCYDSKQPFGCNNYNAARWYCLYLKQLTGNDPGCSETPHYPPYGPCNHAYPPCYPCPPLSIFPCP